VAVFVDESHVRLFDGWARTVRTHRSACAFAFAARRGALIVSMLAAANTASNGR
jgi:hypothetical protein